MLAWLPRAQVRALYPGPERFVSRTGNGPASPAALREVLAQERHQGFSREEGQVTEGYSSVAAAAFDHSGAPIAAISLTVPCERPVTPEALASRARDAAADLTRRLGGRTPALWA